MTVLEEILAHKRREIAMRKAAGDPPAPRGTPPDFVAALRVPPLGLIAEIKRRSPSAGALREPFDPQALARAYEDAGAQAISVLVDERYFGGGEDVFRAVRSVTRLPLLYKEFVVDEWQVRHAAGLGASAVLLIAAALDDVALQALKARVESLGMTPLIEVHDETEMHRAIAANARVIGINNRDLRTFVTTLETAERLAPMAPANSLIIAESGIRGADDARRLKAAGAHALLVGEHLLRAPDVGTALRALRAF